MSEEQPAPPPEQQGLPPGAVPVRIRRAPRYRAFVLAGAIVGLLAGAGLSIALGGGEAPFSRSTVTGYIGVIGLLVGGLVGAAVALLVERPRSGSAKPR